MLDGDGFSHPHVLLARGEKQRGGNGDEDEQFLHVGLDVGVVCPS